MTTRDFHRLCQLRVSADTQFAHTLTQTVSQCSVAGVVARRRRCCCRCLLLFVVVCWCRCTDLPRRGSVSVTGRWFRPPSAHTKNAAHSGHNFLRVQKRRNLNSSAVLCGSCVFCAGVLFLLRVGFVSWRCPPHRHADLWRLAKWTRNVHWHICTMRCVARGNTSLD